MFTLLDYLKDELNVTVDSRAALRQTESPQVVSVLCSTLSLASLLQRFAKMRMAPAVIVDENGKIYAYSSGGSGKILFCGEEMTERQQEIVERIKGYLRSMGAIDGDPFVMRVL